MIPTTCKLRPLTANFEGLKRHSQLLIFLPEDLDHEARRLRGWLLHVGHKAARHYGAARKLVLDQLHASQGPSGEARLPILDFSLEMEDCVTSIYKANMCVNLLARRNLDFAKRPRQLHDEKHAIAELRNTLEHMYTAMAGGQSGTGPVVIALDAAGDHICLGKRRVDVQALPAVLENIFETVAGLFPKFDLTSAPEPAGVVQLGITATIEVHKVSAPGPAGHAD